MSKVSSSTVASHQLLRAFVHRAVDHILSAHRKRAVVSPEDMNAKTKNILGGVVPSSITADDSKVHFVFRCKYQEPTNTIVPQRPALHFRRDVRLPAGTIVQLNMLG